jgi:hypothetical protein
MKNGWTQINSVICERFIAGGYSGSDGPGRPAGGRGIPGYPPFTRYVCQIRQAPSWLTMQGPMGRWGVQPFP